MKVRKMKTQGDLKISRSEGEEDGKTLFEKLGVF